MDAGESWGLLVAAKSAVLSTADPDRGVHLVPVVFTPVNERRIVIAVDAKPKRSRRLRRLTNIQLDGRVSLLVDAYEDDWSKLWWVRVDGTATVVDSVGDAAQAMHRSRYPQAADHLLGPWIDIEISAVSGWHA